MFAFLGLPAGLLGSSFDLMCVSKFWPKLWALIRRGLGMDRARDWAQMNLAHERFPRGPF